MFYRSNLVYKLNTLDLPGLNLGSCGLSIVTHHTGGGNVYFASYDGLSGVATPIAKPILTSPTNGSVQASTFSVTVSPPSASVPVTFQYQLEASTAPSFDASQYSDLG